MKMVKYLILAILLILVIFRFTSLDNDPPLYFTGHGQAHLTDPYHLTFSARNATLFSDWKPFDFDRWDIFKNSLISGFSYLAFQLFGVSRITANLVAVVMNMVGLILFLFAILKYRNITEAVIAAFLLLINSSFFFYARLPFLENGLIFIAGFIFLLFMKFNDRIGGQLILGAAVAIAALAGKLFGLILLGTVVLSLIYKYRKRSLTPILMTLAGFIAGAALYIVIFYGGSVSTLANYYAEQTTGMYGFPPGLASIPNFFKMFVTYGGESGLTEFSPLAAVLSVLSLISIFLIMPIFGPYRREYLPVIFCLAWLILGVLGLMPFKYRPLRYSLFLFLPAAGICTFFVREIFIRKLKFALYSWKVTLPIIFFVLWYFFAQIYTFLSPFGTKFKSAVQAMPIAGFAALVITVLIFLWLRNRKGKIPSGRLPWRIRAVSVGILLLAMVILQSTYLYRGLDRPGKYLEQYNSMISEIVDSNAVLTGPYAPALTIDNNQMGIIYVFGLSRIERDLFEKFPITHIVSDRPNWSQALIDFPFLKSAVRITQMVIRDQVITLYRLPRTGIPLTDFERGALYFARNEPDSAYNNFRKFSVEHPGNLLGAIHLVYALNAIGRVDEAVDMFKEIVSSNSDNYMIHGVGDGFYRRLYKETGDITYQKLAKFHEDKAEKLNRYMAAAN
jgi:4-amino-4-deoxy-L-arabinose transferase-like glycosyltransferase